MPVSVSSPVLTKVGWAMLVVGFLLDIIGAALIAASNISIDRQQKTDTPKKTAGIVLIVIGILLILSSFPLLPGSRMRMQPGITLNL